MKPARFVLGLVLQLTAATALFGAIVVWRGPRDPMRWSGVLLGFPALIGMFVARFQLGESFSVTPQARKLVTHGVYSKIRNPIYVFGSLLLIGFALATHLLPVLLILLILTPLQVFRARQEARVLEEKFGDEYREYHKKTWF